MIQNIKKIAAKFKKKYNLIDINEKTLREIFEQQGYTVIYFHKILNDENVYQVIRNLNLQDLIESHKGFTYTSENYRLVFINDDLTEDEKVFVMAHEEGHIFCEHTKYKAIIGEDVMEEHEANEFVHYLLHQNRFDTVKYLVKQHKKVFYAVCACVLAIVVGITTLLILSKEKTYVTVQTPARSHIS